MITSRFALDIPSGRFVVLLDCEIFWTIFKRKMTRSGRFNDLRVSMTEEVPKMLRDILRSFDKMTAQSIDRVQEIPEGIPTLGNGN